MNELPKSMRKNWALVHNAAVAVEDEVERFLEDTLFAVQAGRSENERERKKYGLTFIEPFEPVAPATLGGESEPSPEVKAMRTSRQQQRSSQAFLEELYKILGKVTVMALPQIAQSLDAIEWLLRSQGYEVPEPTTKSRIRQWLSGYRSI